MSKLKITAWMAFVTVTGIVLFQLLPADSTHTPITTAIESSKAQLSTAPVPQQAPKTIRQQQVDTPATTVMESSKAQPSTAPVPHQAKTNRPQKAGTKPEPRIIFSE